MRIFDGVSRLQGGLDYHLARHNLLVSNLSHVDTPGFQPLDLERVDFGSVMASLQATHPDHYGTQVATGPNGVAAASGTLETKVFADPAAQAGPDGNAVSLDREAVKIASNQVRYDVIAQLVAGQLGGLQWAANDGRSG